MKIESKGRLFLHTGVWKKAIVLLVFCAAVASCKKDSDYDTPDPVCIPVKVVGTPGSWWKYEWYDVDGSGIAVSKGIVDSFYVADDTVIKGHTYTHIGGGGSFYGNAAAPHRYLRDSADCILNSRGEIIYRNRTTLDSSEVFTNGFVTEHMLTRSYPFSYTVPAGSFSKILENQTHVYLNDGSDFECGNRWIQRKYYAEGIGLIMAQAALVSQLLDSCKFVEMRLIDYQIAP